MCTSVLHVHMRVCVCVHLCACACACACVCVCVCVCACVCVCVNVCAVEKWLTYLLTLLCSSLAQGMLSKGQQSAAATNIIITSTASPAV